MCMYRQVVDFLRNPACLSEVDPSLQPLVVHAHCIPQCATFGVSCAAGHLYFYGDGEKKLFAADLDGRLCVIVVPEKPHIAELLGCIRDVVSGFEDTSFKKIEHCFGPPMGSAAEVWEIRIGPNGSFASLGREYGKEYLSIAEHEKIFLAASLRAEEIEAFWKTLAENVAAFRNARGFCKFNLAARKVEIWDAWDRKIPRVSMPTIALPQNGQAPALVG